MKTQKHIYTTYIESNMKKLLIILTLFCAGCSFPQGYWIHAHYEVKVTHNGQTSEYLATRVTNDFNSSTIHLSDRYGNSNKSAITITGEYKLESTYVPERWVDE